MKNNKFVSPLFYTFYFYDQENKNVRRYRLTYFCFEPDTVSLTDYYITGIYCITDIKYIYINKKEGGTSKKK